mgnify:FL=1
MSIQDCREFALAHPACFFATTDGNQPRVRALLLWRADDNGFIFETQNPKQVYRQMKENPKVEVCFFNNEGELEKAKTLRVTGEVEFLNDADLKKQLMEEWAFLKPAEPVTELFRIKTGEAFFWTMADFLKEQEIARVKF